MLPAARTDPAAHGGRRSGGCSIRPSRVDAAGARSGRHADRGRSALQELLLDPAPQSADRVLLRGMAAARPRRIEAPVGPAQPHRLGPACDCIRMSSVLAIREKAAGRASRAGDRRRRRAGGPIGVASRLHRSGVRVGRRTKPQGIGEGRTAEHDCIPAASSMPATASRTSRCGRSASGIVLVNARRSVRDAARALGKPIVELSGRIGP